MEKVDLHIHTVHSDGATSVADVARRARRAGAACGVCDHLSPYHKMFEAEAFDAYVADVRAHGLLLGAEYCIGVDIPVGAERLAALDYLMGGVHAVRLGGRNYFFWAETQPAAENVRAFVDAYTQTLLAALAGGALGIIAHPTYLPYYLQDRYDEIWDKGRTEKVWAAAAEAGVALEISGRWLVPQPGPLQLASDMGLNFTLGSDAHRPEEILKLEYPLAMIKKFNIPEDRIFVPGRGG